MGRHLVYHIGYILLFLSLKVSCYEKTLRKIVRNQSKMVQTPFSNGGDLIWKNTSQSHLLTNQALILQAPMMSTFHKLQRPKISTILSSVETGRGKATYSKMKIAKKDVSPIELRLARNTFFGNFTSFPNQGTGDSQIEQQSPTYKSNHKSDEIAIETFYKIPSKSKFFPSVDEHDIQSLEQRSTSKENTIVIPENISPQINDSVLLKSVFVAVPKSESKNLVDLREIKISLAAADPENEKADFLLEGMQADINSLYSYNVSVNPYSCTDIKEVKADIDAQATFAEIDIEPSWMSRKHFWNSIFDSRYESLMRNPKWPPLKVILIPRSQVDSIWKRTFDQYHNESVSKILSNIVKKLQFYNNLTFNWNEVSHLSQWWKSTSSKSRMTLRKLLKSGRFEITTGGWVEPDEATTHIFGLVHQLVEGHQWLKCHLDYTPTVGWQTNTVTHSPTMPYILSASEITRFVFTNIHYSMEKYLSEYQYSDFIWLQDWDNDMTSTTSLNDALNKIGKDRYPRHSVVTHFMQFNSAGFKACGPNKAVCLTDFNFAKSNKNIDINSYNVKEKSELILEQYSKTGTLSPHNVIMAPIGGPYRYELQSEFDYQYNNYQKVADFININRDIYKATIEFGTPKDYFNAVFERHKHFQTLKGDFLNFADISSGFPAYWTGFFTTRPLFKILLRRLESTLRTTEILFSFGIHYNAFSGYNATDIFFLLIKARQTVARLLDRNVSSGTLTANALKYAHHQMIQTVRDCWFIQELATSLLSIKPEERQQQKAPYLQKYVYREGEFMSTFKAVSPGDQIYVFNSLSHERTEIIELITRTPNVRIIDHNRKDVTIQINPIWEYNSDNFIKISRRFFKISFAVAVPPLTLELFKIKDTYDSSYSFSTIYCINCIIDDVTSNGSIFPFNIHPVEAGDIQLESYKHRLIFDEFTGFMKTVVEKETNIEKTIVLDYGAFRDSNVNSGMFLFNTNASKPLYDILMPFRVGTKRKIVMIISGQVTTELITIYGRLLQHSVKIFNLMNSPLSGAIFIESKVDYEVSPKNRELELFMSIQTDISNGNPPQIFTDNNGFQYTERLLNITRRIESNMYPITTMAYIEDQRSRFTFITDHAQGVTALQEGQLVVMLDRRVLFNDGRGTNEGLADSSATCHRHILLLENFMEYPHGFSEFPPQSSSKLPSLSAIYLSNALNYQLDIFIFAKNQSNQCYYTFLPLIKTSFPCDVSVLNYRLVLNEDHIQNYTPNTALLILHRQSVSCQVNNGLPLHCSSDTYLSLNKILRNVKAAFHTNLVGTNKGVPLLNLNQVTFPPMELTTIKIYF